MKKLSEMTATERQVLNQRVQLYGGIAAIFILSALFLQYFNVRQLATDGIAPTPRAAVEALAVTPVRQDNPAWGDLMLGETGYTMAQEGSLFACLSMLMEHAGTAETPGAIYNAFVSGGLLLEGRMADATRLDTLYPFKFSAPRTFDGKTMTDLLRKGTPVMVRAKKEGNAYWLCVIGATREDFIVLSPLDGQQKLLSEFGNVYAMGYLTPTNGR